MGGGGKGLICSARGTRNRNHISVEGLLWQNLFVGIS